MDLDTENLLRSSLRYLLEHPSEEPLRLQLRRLGWDEVVADDQTGALRLLFETRAATLSPVDALTPVMAASVAQVTGVPEAASATIVFPLSLHPAHPSSMVQGSRVRIEGVTPDPPTGALLIPISGPAGPDLLLLEEPEGFTGEVTSLSGMDPSMRWQVTGSPPPGDGRMLGWEAWSAACITGRWALATELVTMALGVVRDAVDYAGTRVQYGRPIGTFQALQQRLASAHASAVGAADVARQASESGSPWDALVAKALAGRAAEAACTQAQQCFGAIGFTWEHPFPHQLRRVYLLDRLLGDWRTLETEIGTTLLQSRQMRRVGAL